MEKEYVSNNLQKLRKQGNITQEELATSVGVSRQTIVAIEKGNYVPSLLLGMKIAHFFKKSVEDIFVLMKK
jgi:putative transcriptional regulator